VADTPPSSPLPPPSPEPLRYAQAERKRWPLWLRLLIIVPLSLLGLLLLAFGACLVMMRGL